MDGLLFDSERLYREIFCELLEEAGREQGKARFPQLVGLGWKETCHRLENWYPGIDAAGFVADWKRAVHPDRGRMPRCKTGVNAVLDPLDELGIARAIATGSQRSVASAYLAHHGLTDRFQRVIASEDCAQGKPHPEPFQRAAAAIGIEPERCLALEDSRNGIRSAHAAGAVPVMVPDMVEPDDAILALAHDVAPDLHHVAEAIRAS